jgi:hypothetical protein
VHVHIVSVVDNDGVGLGDVDDALVQRQISVLNAAYAAPAAAEQAGVLLQFKAVNISRSTTSPDEDMCDPKSEKILKTKLRTGGADVLNLYITDLNPCGVYGWSTWPWDIEKKGLANDGVVVHYDTLPGGQTLQYNRGATAVHEIGHFLGEAAAEHTASVCCAAAAAAAARQQQPRSSACVHNSHPLCALQQYRVKMKSHYTGYSMLCELAMILLQQTCHRCSTSAMHYIDTVSPPAFTCMHHTCRTLPHI